VRTLGWTREGTKREAFLVDGQYYDLECWAILRHEYEPDVK
jgi:RimJ/RimL family protein N-acetyltransferase